MFYVVGKKHGYKVIGTEGGFGSRSEAQEMVDWFASHIDDMPELCVVEDE